MTEAQPAATPMATKLKLEKLDSLKIDTHLYQSMLGSIMYAMTGTHPDIVFAIGYLSQHASAPSTEHLSALK
jgi:hypothetical protein